VSARDRQGGANLVAQVLNRIQAAFLDRGVPAPASLVVFDGFDQLDKETAVEAFAGRTREEVAALIGRGPRGYEGLWGIEELAFLEPAPLQYYLEPFLRHLLTQEHRAPQDLSYWLSFHLAEALARRGPEIFDGPQQQAVVELARLFDKRLTEPYDWYDEGWHEAHQRSYTSLIERLGP
jgi:hypothetical protein